MAIVVFARPLRFVTVLEYERGLRYVKGRFTEVLAPGKYSVWRYSTTINKIDTRPRVVSVPGQEVLSADGLTLKASLAAVYEISDPNTAINKLQDFQSAFYLALQVALREVIGSTTMEELLAKRAGLGQKVREIASATVEPYGLRLVSADIKDIMLPGDLKRIFAQVVKSRQEGLAALEKARGETAALRNLANAARLVETNPTLLQLRMLHTIGDSGGNTFVVGLPSTVVPVGPAPQEHQPEQEQEGPSSGQG